MQTQKVTYVDESFSSFNVTDKVTIRCIAENKFEIVKDGKTVKKATAKRCERLKVCA